MRLSKSVARLRFNQIHELYYCISTALNLNLALTYLTKLLYSAIGSIKQIASLPGICCLHGQKAAKLSTADRHFQASCLYLLHEDVN